MVKTAVLLNLQMGGRILNTTYPTTWFRIADAKLDIGERCNANERLMEKKKKEPCISGYVVMLNTVCNILDIRASSFP